VSHLRLNSKVNYLQLDRHRSSQSHCCWTADAAVAVVDCVDEGDYEGDCYDCDGDDDDVEMGRIDCEWDEC